ncbi:putative esterase [Glycocaulis alkaliphilus]|uniref:Putative esterase n=1 Tax=Glycocaulis alkaliphilus TaxID=1434191 RepID=A0A3T0ECZ3_9PROT|nr:putative esterase [Glycocaulis alkaliphilus]
MASHPDLSRRGNVVIFRASAPSSGDEEPVLVINGAGSFPGLHTAQGHIACIVLPDFDRATFEYTFAPRSAPLDGEYVGPDRYDDIRLYTSRTAPHRYEEHVLDSMNLNAERRVFVYIPTDGQCAARGGCPVVFTGDAMAADRYGATIDALVSRGIIEPVIMASTMLDPMHRRTEYARLNERSPANQVRFDAHARFFAEEFIPWVEDNFQVSDDPAHRVLFGFSASADFALAMAEAMPESFGSVLAASPPMNMPVNVRPDDQGACPDVIIRYGSWEGGIATGIRAHADASNACIHLEETPAGHARQLATEMLVRFLTARYGVQDYED